MNHQPGRNLSENPFAPGVPATPSSFVGRTREVELIFGHVLAAQRGSVAIHGALGLGKTSLLRYVNDPEVAARHGAGSDVAFVYVDTQSVTPFSTRRFWRRVARLLEREERYGLSAPASALMARDELDIVDLEEFLDGVAAAGRVLVVLLDEFEWALQADSLEEEAESRNLLAQLASLLRRTPRVLAVVVATERPLPEATRVIESWRGSPFATLFTSVTLKPLTREASDEALDRALAGQEMGFSAGERVRLHELSAGVPAALQAAAFQLYHGRGDGPTGARLWDAVEAAARGQVAHSMATPPSDGRTAVAGVSRPTSDGVRVDRGSGEVYVDGRHINSLTALEFNLLEFLLAEPGRLRTREEIVGEVWGDGVPDDTRVEKLVSRLRRKVETIPGRPQHIRTVRGRGYRLVG